MTFDFILLRTCIEPLSKLLLLHSRKEEGHGTDFCFQLFTLTVCFQIGTTVIFGFASSAGRDAWLSSLISMSIGIIIIVMHTFLMKYNPGLTLVEWFPAQFGRWLGVPLAWLYPLNFLYLGGRTLADMKSLIPATLLPGTPSWFVIAAMLLVIIYCLFSGIEVLARLIEYLLPTLFLFFIIEIVLFFSSGLVHFKNLQPIVGQGWGRCGQPYGRRVFPYHLRRP